MLAPFTAGWQTTESQPLVIEKSEVHNIWVSFLAIALAIISYKSPEKFLVTWSNIQGCYVYDLNGKKYLDALAGLWCTALGNKNVLWIFYLSLDMCYNLCFKSYRRKKEFLHWLGSIWNCFLLWLKELSNESKCF